MRTKWIIEKIFEEAIKYKTRNDFYKNSPAAYKAAWRRNILDQVCAHMPQFVTGKDNPRFKWDLQKLKDEAVKYKTRTEFRNRSYSAYCTAIARGVLNQICIHMKASRGSSVYEKDLLKIIQTYHADARTFRDIKINIEKKPHIKGFDLDIFIPRLNKGIEFDGTYWHSVEGLSRSRKHWPKEDIENYHEIKTEHFASKGIQVFHVKEQDWIENKEQCIYKCIEFLGI